VFKLIENQNGVAYVRQLNQVFFQMGNPTQG